MRAIFVNEGILLISSSAFSKKTNVADLFPVLINVLTDKPSHKPPL